MTNTKRIIYLNTFAWGAGHEMFNAGILAMCSLLNCEVICKTTKSNYTQMRKTASVDNFGQNVKYHRTRTLGGGGRFALLFRYVWGAITSYYHILLSRKTDTLILPFNNLFALKYINLISKITSKKIIIFCHGELEFISSNENKAGILSSILYKKCTSFFCNPETAIGSGMYFSVLGEKIKSNLKKHLDSTIIDKFMTMDHPYFFLDNINPNPSTCKPLRIGTCGAMNIPKGALELANFAKLCMQEGLDIEIVHTGKVFAGLPELIEGGIKILSPNNELSREQYNTSIQQLDYMLFFYPATNYKITASGAIMDAIALKKPIIAIRNDYFEYLFDKFGHFGYLVDSTTQMVEILSSILQGERVVQFDFEQIQRKFRPQAIAGQLANIINQVNDRS